MIIAARQSFWSISGKTPPWDYQVEYLQSDGTNCLDTGMVITNGCYIKLDWEVIDSYSSDKHYHGVSYWAGIGTYRSCYRPTGYATEAFSCYEGIRGPGNVWPPAVLINDDYHTIFTQDDTHTTIWSVTNNKLLCDYPIRTWSDNTAKYRLFWMINSPVYKGSCRVYGFEFKSDKQEQKLVPCVKDGVPCFADVVNGNFLYKDEGNDFIAGPVVQ